MTLKNIWTDDKALGRFFAWQTRIGIAPKFGSMPIHYYQQDQCKAIDAIEAALKPYKAEDSEFKYANGLIKAKLGTRWTTVAMVVCGELVNR